MTWIIFVGLGWLIGFSLTLYLAGKKLKNDGLAIAGNVLCILNSLLLLISTASLLSNVTYNNMINDYKILLERMEYQYQKGISFSDTYISKYQKLFYWMHGLQHKNDGLWDWYIPDGVMKLEPIPINELEDYFERKKE